MNGSEVGTGKHGYNCREVAIKGRFSIRRFKQINQMSNQEDLVIVQCREVADVVGWSLVKFQSTQNINSGTYLILQFLEYQVWKS